MTSGDAVAGATRRHGLVMAPELAVARTLLLAAALCWEVGTVSGASSSVTFCSCDLTPGSCDINCCCDPDCTASNLTALFSFCLPGSTKAERWVCLSNWLIFRNNTPYTTAVVGSPPTELFCVLSAGASLNYFVSPQTVNASNFPTLSAAYQGPSFSAASVGVPQFPSFYRADDPVLTVSTLGALSVLRQPAPLGAQRVCSSNNPAKFLRSGSTSCIHVLSNLTDSCGTDLSLDASYYYQDITVLPVPADVTNQTARGVPIISTAADLPILQGDYCNNVVTQVEYTVLYNGTQGITNVSVVFTLTNVSTTSPFINQIFTVVYKPLSSAAQTSAQSRSGNPGYLVGFPVLSDSGHLSLLRSLVGESCAYSPVRFGMNSLSGCMIRGTTQETCSDLQARSYQLLLGGSAPQSLAMFGNTTTTQSGSWTPILYENCSSQGDCSSNCLLPVSLHMQILWASVGLLANPQSQVLGARFSYRCQLVKCQDATVLQTRVSFTDLTLRGPAPRANPSVTGRDPLGFFSPFQSSGTEAKAGSPLLALGLLVVCWVGRG
ncbi:tectonic-3 [Pseudophryne corroboree]|uniref:tectonic-3 n=1 Tax=Pseudophryne corroboree TaxID=495146 RepID=UPI003081A34A